MSAIRNQIIPIEVRTPGAGDFVPTVTAYLPEGGELPRPAVVIFSGGAYKVVSQYEAAPTARKYADRGFAAFTVSYSCMPATFPQSLCEGLWTVRYVREHAAEWGVDPGNITAMGFSAGGHLAACMGTLWERPELEDFLGAGREDCRPDRLVLCYPVLSNEGEYHRESFLNLLGQRRAEDETLRRLTCPEHHVGSRTPPVFLWHGFADTAVPVIGSIRFAAALAAHGVYTEFHLYPFAGHGGGLNRGTDQGEWSDKAERFMRDERLRGMGRLPDAD